MGAIRQFPGTGGGDARTDLTMRSEIEMESFVGTTIIRHKTAEAAAAVELAVVTNGFFFAGRT